MYLHHNMRSKGGVKIFFGGQNIEVFSEAMELRNLDDSLLESIIDRLDVGVFVLNRDLEVQLWNKFMMSRSGLHSTACCRSSGSPRYDSGRSEYRGHCWPARQT